MQYLLHTYFYNTIDLETDCYKNKLTVIRIKIESSLIINLECWKSNNLRSLDNFNSLKISILLRLFSKE